MADSLRERLFYLQEVWVETPEGDKFQYLYNTQLDEYYNKRTILLLLDVISPETQFSLERVDSNNIRLKKIKQTRAV